ncbi:MAG: hypothetical protein LBP22_03485 [Deltaproteobacteria bacterium]|nr:hypothetical protein [Deltaproteobacteria bacterium]
MSEKKTSDGLPKTSSPKSQEAAAAQKPEAGLESGGSTAPRGYKIAVAMDSFEEVDVLPGAHHLTVYQADGQGDFQKQPPIRLAEFPMEEIVHRGDTDYPRDMAKLAAWLKTLESCLESVGCLVVKDFAVDADYFFALNQDRSLVSVEHFQAEELKELSFFALGETE